MTATALTHFLAALVKAPARTSMAVDRAAGSQTILRGNEPSLAWRCVR